MRGLQNGNRNWRVARASIEENYFDKGIKTKSLPLAATMSDKQKAKPAKEQSQRSADPVNIEPSADSSNNAEILVLPQESESQSPKGSLETDMQAVEASFAKGLTDKMSHATMPGARDLASVVGDPHATETHWYAACEVAGDRCLAGKPSFLKVAAFRTAALCGVVFSFFSIMACYVASIFLGSDFSSMGLGLPSDAFLNALMGLDYVGFIVAGAATITFWSAFFGYFKKTFKYLTIGLFLVVMIKVMSFHLMIGIPAATLWGVAYLPALYLADWLGGVCREALPLHIGSRKLAASLLPSVIIPGLVMMVILYAVYGPGNTNDPVRYLDGNLKSLILNSFLVSLCTLVPGFVLARATKSKSSVASATLAVLLQTPLILGLLLTVGACVLLGLAYKSGLDSRPFFAFLAGMGTGNWALYGGTKAIAIIGSMLVAAASAAGGGALGAWWNNAFGVEPDAKPAPSELR